MSFCFSTASARDAEDSWQVAMSAPFVQVGRPALMPVRRVEPRSAFALRNGGCNLHGPLGLMLVGANVDRVVHLPGDRSDCRELTIR